MNNSRLIQFAIRNGYCAYEATLFEVAIKEYNQMRDMTKTPNFKEDYLPHEQYAITECLIETRKKIDNQLEDIRNFLRKKGFRI